MIPSLVENEQFPPILIGNIEFEYPPDLVGNIRCEYHANSHRNRGKKNCLINLIIY